MSGECETCGEHCVDCKCFILKIYPPEGMTFAECVLCKNPFVYDGNSENCLWCEINNEQEQIRT